MKVTLLCKEHLFGNDRLTVIENHGVEAILTDYAILCGSKIGDLYFKTSGIYGGRTGEYWTRTPVDSYIYNIPKLNFMLPNASMFALAKKDSAVIVNLLGECDKRNINKRDTGIRPVIEYDKNKKYHHVCLLDGIEVVEYGSYPQTVVDTSLQKRLDFINKYGTLNKTGNYYTLDVRNVESIEKEFIPQTVDEIEFKNKRYVRVPIKRDCSLSNGEKYREGNNVWIKVEPIRWLVDEKRGLLISERILLSGLQFDHKKEYDGNFSNTDIYKYLNNYFENEMLQTAYFDREENNDMEEKPKLVNAYGFDFDNVSEEEIIKGAILSNVAVFLHGKSSDGKSARIRELDPDCEIIYMRNATPDSLNGKSVYNSNTGEMLDIPPTWYQKVCEKCEKEPDKIHLVFFDELTNALPSIQGMAFNIILNGEVNGMWKLPDNARIVAAGNELADSIAANQMAEPLFNRFAHVYINTTVESWLKWASNNDEIEPKLEYKKDEKHPKVHPSIYAFIAYKAYTKDDVLRTPYTGDKPNADPRKWEMSSRVLYTTHKPHMLRSLIGEELTSEFIAFTRQKILSIEDVINGNYTQEDLNMNISNKFATAVGLSLVDEEHFEIVRNFMKEIGAEPKALFESLWTHGNESRLEFLEELRMQEAKHM